MNTTLSTRRDFLQSAGWAVAGAALGARVQAADPVAADAALQTPQSPRSPKTPLTARLVRHGGVLKIEIDGAIFDPLAYRSYRPTPELIRGFAGTGLKLANVTHTGMLCTLDVPYSLFGEVWTGPEQFDWKAFDAQMALFEANAPGESRPSLQDNETRAHCRIPLPHCRTWLARGRAVSLWAIQPALACASILCHKWINAMAGQAGGPPSGGGFQRGEVESAGIVTL